MTQNKYQRKLESILKVRALFPNATVCNFQVDHPDFFPNALRLQHPELGILVIIGEPMLGQN
jgi:hypothetical protein